MSFTQIIANSLIIGSMYALVAVGFSLIYATNKFMHFAHGASIAVSGYMLYTLFTRLEIPFVLACFLTILFTGLFGFAMYCCVYSPLQKKKASSVVLLIAGLGLLILIQNILQLLFDANVKSIGYGHIQEGIIIFGAVLTPLQLVMLSFSLLLFLALWFVMYKTKLGMMMRAVADTQELAAVVGINPEKIASYSFFIGSGLAGIAGIIIGLERSLTPTMGTDLMVRGFTGAVIGGMGSVPGSIVGSLILGFAENVGIWFLPSAYKDAITFTLLFVFLLWKPTGLFGMDQGVKQ